MTAIDRTEGRQAFGADPACYDRARPDYPPRVYDLLRERCGLRPGTPAFEIGPGTGKATRHLLHLGAAPLVVVEPDDRLAAYLKATLGPYADTVEVTVAAFEEARLPAASFDLGVAASAFHWLDAQTALAQVARLLRPGGWWAMWWSVFQDPSRPDEFRDATQGLLGGLRRSPASGDNGRPSFALDVDARIDDLHAVGVFEDIQSEVIRWEATFDAAQVRELYGTFSPVSRLPDGERQRLLDALGRVAEEHFGGRVERPMLTPVYTARRRPLRTGGTGPRRRIGSMPAMG
jgi:SAM-dependent methyltransferase